MDEEQDQNEDENGKMDEKCSTEDDNGENEYVHSAINLSKVSDFNPLKQIFDESIHILEPL